LSCWLGCACGDARTVVYITALHGLELRRQAHIPWSVWIKYEEQLRHCVFGGTSYEVMVMETRIGFPFGRLYSLPGIEL